MSHRWHRGDMPNIHESDDGRGTLTVTFGHEELILRRRYEIISIGNDLLIALWFVVGVCCSSGSPPPPSARGSSCSGVSNSPRGPSSACSGGSICAVSAVSVPRPHVTSKGPIRSPDITVSSFRYETRPRFFGVFERYVCLRAPELEEPVGGHAASSTETRDPPMSGRNGELRLPGDGRCSIRLSEMSSNATPSTRTGFRSSTRRCRQEGCRSKETVGQLRERSAGDGTGGHEADPDRSHPPVEVLGEGVGVG